MDLFLCPESHHLDNLYSYKGNRQPIRKLNNYKIAITETDFLHLSFRLPNPKIFHHFPRQTNKKKMEKPGRQLQVTPIHHQTANKKDTNSDPCDECDDDDDGDEEAENRSQKPGQD